MVTLQLLGGLTLEGPDGALTGPATQRKRLALLALLAVAPAQRLPRDKLLAFLWPDSAPGPSRHQLSSALYEVRKAVGEEAILVMGEELRLNPTVVRADLFEFESALERGDHERAVALYRAPFLDGFFLSGAPEFEHWVDGERNRLADRYARALEALAEKAEADLDHTRAVEWWKVRAAHDPYDSRVALRLIQALDSSGNRAGALQHATLHQLLLREEFDAEPSPELAALAERIRAGAPDRSALIAQPPERGAPADGPAETLAAAADDQQDETRDGPAHVGAAGLLPARSGASWTRVAAVVATLLVVALAGWLSANAQGRNTAEVRRLAVLPLANLTGDPQQDHFAAGMHDVLIAELAQIAELTIYSRQSVLRYQDSKLPLQAIARELGVDALVEGSVFRSGDSVRITVQLVRAQTDEHLWAASHYGPVSRALELQGEVARAIAGAIRVRIAPEVDARLGRGRAVSPAAQDAYLRGLYHLERGSYGQLVPAPERLAEHRTAIHYLEEAVGLDPDWAAAHAKLALVYHWSASGFGGKYEAEFYPKAKAAALRALALDEAESQAHASLGFVRFMYEWDWAGAERSIRRALELDPNSHHWTYALFLQAAGRHDEAIAHFRRAQERNPLSEALSVQIASALECAGRHAEAIDQSEQLEARMAASGDAHPAGYIARAGPTDFRALVHSMNEMHPEAIAMAEAAVALSDSLPGAVTNLAFVHARAGRHREARALTARAEEKARAAGRVWRPMHLYAALGDTERALAMLEADLEGRRGPLAHFRCTYTYRMLRDEPRVQALLRPVGYPK